MPLLGGGLLLPMLPASARAMHGPEPEEEYQTLLRADGTVVRVKKSQVSGAKVVKQNVNNTELLRWLGKDNKKT